MQRETKQQKKQHNPHDKLFKKFMEDPSVASEFFATYLPPEVRTLCDISTLKQTSGSFISPELATHYNDVLYIVNTVDGEESYLYFLVEHQSTPDKWIALRILYYVLSTLMRHLVQYPKTKKLPLVFPILLYAGKRTHPDTIPLNWLALFEHADLAKKIYNMPFWSIDINKLHTETTKVGTLFYLLRETPYQQIIEMLERFKIYVTEASLNQELVDVSINYIYNVAKNEKPQKLKHYLKNTHLGGGTVNYAQYLHHKGMQEGIAVGKEEGMQAGMQTAARNMLNEGMDSSLIRSVTGLTDAEIQKLKSAK